MIGLLAYKGWMIEQGYAGKMAPILLRALERGTLDQLISKGKESNANIIDAIYGGLDGESFFDRNNPAPPYFVTTSKSGAKVGIVSMIGPITKNGDACSWGMRDYQNTLALLAKREDIKAVVLHLNNAPGGTHDGTPEMSSLIKGYKKSIVSFVDGYAASAHYYMASQSDHIMMNKLTPSEVGSIGSLVVYENVQNQIAEGFLPKMEIIRAPQSFNKALMNSIEPLTDNLRIELLAELKDSVNQFIAAVKSGRGDKLVDDGEMFTGKMYNTKEAIANGLADSKGSLMDAINLAGELSKGIPKSTSAPTGAQVNTNMKFPKISALFGKSEKAATEQSEEKSLSAEEQASMEAAEKKLAEMETSVTTATQALQAATEKVGQLEQSITDLNTQLETLKGEKATLTEEKKALQTKLDEAPAGAKTQISREKDSGHENDEKNSKKFRTSVDDEVDSYVTKTQSK